MDVRFDPEREVTIDDRFFPMSAARNFVRRYTDKFPDDVVEKLVSYVHIHRAELKGKLADDPSYSTGAYCLRKLIESGKK